MKKPSNNIGDYSDFELLHPGKYIKGAEVKAAGKPIPLTIARIEPRHEMKGKNGESEAKPCLFFDETEKGCVLNKTNTAALAGILGRDPRKWIKKKVVLRAEPGRYFGELRTPIRIDIQATKRANGNGGGPTAPVSDFEDAPDVDEQALADAARAAEQDEPGSNG